MDSKDRSNYLSSLTEFIEEKAGELQTFCHQLGWSTKLETTDSAQLCECPFDPGHWVPPTSLPEHIERCQLAQRGYAKDEVLFPPVYTEGGPVVTLSQKEQFDIIQTAAAKNPSIPRVSAPPDVPQSASRLVTSLTTQHRLALYEHVASETADQRPGILKYTEVDLAFDEKPEEPGGAKSFWEILAQERDAKRRRLNYRQAKKVHTKHKSQTEVTREVIENQMELYTEWLQQKNPDSREANPHQPTEETEDGSQSAYEDKCSIQYDMNNRREKYSDRETYSRDRSYDRHSHSSRHKHDRSRSSSKYHDYEGVDRDHSRKHRDRKESRSHSRSDDRHSRKKHKHKHSSKR